MVCDHNHHKLCASSLETSDILKQVLAAIKDVPILKVVTVLVPSIIWQPNYRLRTWYSRKDLLCSLSLSNTKKMPNLMRINQN